MMHHDIDAYRLNDGSLSGYQNVQVASLGNRYEVGDWVAIGDGEYGLVVDVNTESFEWPEAEDEEISASDRRPVYIVAQGAGGSAPYHASELSKTDRDTVFNGDPPEDEVDKGLEETDQENLSDVYEGEHAVEELTVAPGVDVPGDIGFSSWPDSWEEADQPARLIALDAWTSMGPPPASFTGCTRTMKGKVSSPDRLCAAYKDEVLGYTHWR